MRRASRLRAHPPIHLGIAEVYLALLSPIDCGAEGGNPALGKTSQYPSVTVYEVQKSSRWRVLDRFGVEPLLFGGEVVRGPEDNFVHRIHIVHLGIALRRNPDRSETSGMVL